jgi:phosphoribosyl-ATP pyrophosphohydrolase/phosphoribosyl-AMP cyclohydrolase/histidinol dehydrogenase
MTSTRARSPRPFPLRILTPARATLTRAPVLDQRAVRDARAIIADVERLGWSEVLRHARRLGDLPARASRTHRAVYEPRQLKAALEALPRDDRDALTRAAERIERFARAQRAALRDLSLRAGPYRVGHRVVALPAAGCYAPGGRFPLPSSVLMTAITARAAGVEHVWVASPRPAPITLAAASLAGADALLAVGGPQAIAALALGAGPVPRCDVVVGPGNRYVTAAKYLVSDRCAIDMLAGPSEVLIIADDSASPATIASDMLAQAEHDPDASCALLTPSRPLILQVRRELALQLESLSTRPTARAALANSFAVRVASLDEAADLANRLAPEHLQLCCENPRSLAPALHAYGAIFIGEQAAEVLGDYGVGPNHTLPTGGSARWAQGLSVFSFLRVRTFVESPTPATARGAARSDQIVRDTVRLARLEGLEAHARAAERRLRTQA